MQQYLEAGKVVTTHGVRGEMKLELWCDGVDFLKKVGRLYPSAQGGKAYKILSIRPQGQMALLQLEGVSDMDAARALRGQVFYFDRNAATLPGPPGCAGYLHRQSTRRQGIYVPRGGRFFERAQPAGGIYPCHPHPRPAG